LAYFKHLRSEGSAYGILWGSLLPCVRFGDWRSWELVFVVVVGCLSLGIWIEPGEFLGL